MVRSMVIVGADSTPTAAPRHRLDPSHALPQPAAWREFADSIRAELQPEGVAEGVAADRVILALGIIREGADDVDRAERSLVRALRAMAQLRALRLRAASSPATAFEPDEPSESWRSRLAFDSSVSETSPVVRGTWITVGQVVSRIVDGWSWADLLRAHPELCEDDLRACMAFATEDEAAR